MQKEDFPDAIIFDWDGTLLDSIGFIVDCFRDTLLDFGVARSDAELQTIIGFSLEKGLEKLLDGKSPAPVAELARNYRRRYAAHIPTAESMPLFPGARRMLENLRKNGTTIAIATGKAREGLSQDLKLHGLSDFFDSTRTADETASKPDPKMVHEIMSELSLKPEKTLFVGDSDVDMRTAHNAGLRSYFVSYGVHSLDQLSVSPSQHFADIESLAAALSPAR